MTQKTVERYAFWCVGAQRGQQGPKGGSSGRSVHPGVMIGVVAAHVDLEFFLRALQPPLAVGVAELPQRVKPAQARRLQRNIAEYHATLVRDFADGARRVERVEEGYAANDHDEIFHLDRDQEVEQHLAIRPHYCRSQQNSVDRARGSQSTGAWISEE